MSHNHTDSGGNRSLQTLRTRLEDIHNSIVHFQPPTSKPSVLDSSVEAGGDEDHWLQQDVVPGLKILRQSIRRDLDVLDKFLADPENASLSTLSTNAPYLIAVWHEVVCARGPITAIFKSFLFSLYDLPCDTHEQGAAVAAAKSPPSVKIDVVADHGRHWIRVNTVKNSRLLAEFRELDSYLTSSESESDEFAQPTKMHTEYDNSVLRIGRSLVEAAKANPLRETNEVPRVTLRLTRLDPSGKDNDPRIARTIDSLRDMGIDVQLGERQNVAYSSTLVTSRSLKPTNRINLDLSVLIALVSDLSHSPVPTSVEEANTRFIPPQRYREWKKSRMAMQGKNESAPAQGDAEPAWALAAQVLQEMRKGLIQELFEKLLTCSSADSTTSPNNPFAGVEFWTTPEARDRCLRIVTKIGGESEKRRVHALFPSDPAAYAGSSSHVQKLEEAYWKDSRYAQGLIPLIPIRVHPPSELSQVHNAEGLSPFFKSLSKICRNILVQETVSDPRSLPDYLVQGDGLALGEIQRATITKANPRLTAHTVQSMLRGASLGWTTLTANRSSVKSILREVQTAELAGALDHDSEAGQDHGPVDYENAVVWVVDPRSLAEGMRSDLA